MQACRADSSGIKADFERDGYVILRNVVAPALRADTYRTVVNLLGKFERSMARELIAELYEQDPWKSQQFHDELIALRVRAPELFSVVYDTIQTSAAIQQMCGCEPLLSAACKAIGEPLSALTMTGHMLRMDVPNDKRNVLDWHQDVSYYNQNLSGANGFVVWIPMHAVNPDNGTIKVLPGSHRERPVTGSADSTSELTSQQFRVPDEIVSKYREVDVIADGGDAVIFSMGLVHRSGYNSSKTVRFAAGIRLHKCLADDFLPGRLLYKANERIGRMVDYLSSRTPTEVL